MRDAAGARGGAPSGKPPVRDLPGQPSLPRSAPSGSSSGRSSCVRDPAAGLPDLADEGARRLSIRGGWTTGFTTTASRFPHFAGSTGAPIYNDVDQIYLADPAELFDQELGGHGMLADRPRRLVGDAARLRAHGDVWSLERAQRDAKGELLRTAIAVPGLIGALAGVWNARDGEYAPGRSKCCTSPRCTPSRGGPSRRNSSTRRTRTRSSGTISSNGPTPRASPSSRARDRARAGSRSARRSSSKPRPTTTSPGCSTKRFAAGSVRERVRCEAPQRGRDTGVRRTADWWTARVDAAARRNPKTSWELELLTPGRAHSWHRTGGPRRSPSRRASGCSTDDRPGNTTQSTGLADALAWPYEVKRLTLGPFARLQIACSARRAWESRPRARRRSSRPGRIS